MAYDFATIPSAGVSAALSVERTDDFRRTERLVCLGGASALGAAAGFAAAIAMGRIELWMVVAAAAPFLLLALYLAGEMVSDGLRRRAFGCAGAASLHVAAILAWPITAYLAPVSMLNFWIAPTMALTALFMLASCWQGSKGGVYRVAAMGLMIAAVAANQGTMLFLGA